MGDSISKLIISWLERTIGVGSFDHGFFVKKAKKRKGSLKN